MEDRSGPSARQINNCRQRRRISEKYSDGIFLGLALWRRALIPRKNITTGIFLAEQRDILAGQTVKLKRPNVPPNVPLAAGERDMRDILEFLPPPLVSIRSTCVFSNNQRAGHFEMSRMSRGNVPLGVASGTCMPKPYRALACPATRVCPVPTSWSGVILL